MKWLLLSLLVSVFAAPPVAVHASPDDPLCSALEDPGNAAVLVQALTTWSEVRTVAQSATVDPTVISTSATAPPVQEVAALSRCSIRTAKAPVTIACEHYFASGGDGYVSLGIAHIWRPPALQRE